MSVNRYKQMKNGYFMCGLVGGCVHGFFLADTTCPTQQQGWKNMRGTDKFCDQL